MDQKVLMTTAKPPNRFLWKPNRQLRWYGWMFGWIVLTWAIEPVIGLAQPGGSETDRTEEIAKGREFTAAELEDLLRQMGSSQYAVRESATEQLAQAGESMLPALEAAKANATDLEVLTRLSGIVARIKQDRIQHQIRMFIRSADPDTTYGFEGWKSFSRVCGNGRNAKLLFLQLLESFPDLVENELATKQAAADRARQIIRLLEELRLQLRGPENPEALGLLYCLNVAEDAADRQMETVACDTFRRAPFNRFISEPQSKKACEKMLGAWCLRLVESQNQLNTMLLFLEQEVPTGRELALSVLSKDSVKNDGDLFLVAMQCLYRFGTPEDLPAVEGWLESKEVCIVEQRIGAPDAIRDPNNPNFSLVPWTIENRDIALAVALRLSSEDAMTYFPQFRTHPIRGFIHSSIALPEGEERIRADRIAQWRAGRKKG